MSDTQTSLAPDPKTTLFISYSLKDIKFVDALAEALEARGYNVLVDRSDIRKGEEWWKRLVDLIVDCMLVVFVISPDSIASPVCHREVDLTKRLGKRIVPLLWRSAPRSDIPEGLAERDWVSFKAVDPSGTWQDPALAGRPAFAAALDELEAAIRLEDVLWAEEQAQWLKRAMEWDRAGRPDGSLMRAGEITAAQTWANRRPQNASQIPDLITDFLSASLAKENRDGEELNQLAQRAEAAQRETDAANRQLEKLQKRHQARHATRGKLFISYRRDDSKAYAGRIYDWLTRDSFRDRVFIDIDTIQKGRDFNEVLKEHLAQCDVMLVLIGPNWLNAQDQSGNRRLHNPDDFVRLEVRAALERDISVIPVILDGAQMPQPEELPEDLRPLVNRQNYSITYEHFGRDVEGLKRHIRPLLQRSSRRLLLLICGISSIAIVILLLYIYRDWVRSFPS